MKPEELQLGDIVTTTPSGMPIKVVAIHRKKVAYHACTDRFSGVRIGLLQPIPLTPEILEENGFERVNGEYQDVFYVYDGIELLIDDVYTLFGQCKMPIKYVHELQHALRLCGINKEIEI